MTDGERDPADVEWTFGVRLREAMDKRGWSEREMARRASVSPQTIANMLIGRKAHKRTEAWRPTQEKVRSVATALEEVPDEWLRMAGYHVPPRAVTGVEQATRLAGKIVHIDEADASALEKLVDSLLRARGYIAADAPRPGGEAEAASRPTVVSHEGELTTAEVEQVGEEFVPDEVIRETSDHQGR